MRGLRPEQPRRARRAVLLVIVAVAVPPGAGARDCDAVRSYPVAGAEWIVREIPAFPAGDAVLRTHAPAPDDSNRIWASNGRIVMATGDGGCTWREVLRAPAGLDVTGLAASAGGASVIAVLETPAAQASIATASGIAVSVARNGGAFGPLQPLAGTGRAGPVVIAPSNPLMAYLAAGSTMWRWDGDDWHAAGPVVEPGKAPDLEPIVRRIEIDPFDSNRLVAKASFSLFVSDDGARSWRRLDRPGDPSGSGLFGPLLSRGSAAAPASMLLMRGTYPTSPVTEYFESRDGGATFDRYDTADFGGRLQGVPVAGAARAAGDVLVATAQPGGGPEHGVWRLDPVTRRFVDVDRYGFGPFDEVVAITGTNPMYSLASASLIATYRDGGRPPRASARELPPLVRIPSFDPPPPPPLPPVTMQGVPPGLALQTNESSSHEVRVALPAVPTALDVFFLVDTSGSQTPSVRGLATGIDDIVRALAGAGIDAQFGLGEFRDVNTLRYRRRADIGPPDRAFQYQLERLYTAGGIEEPHLTALHQVATGSGLPGRGDALPVPAGQDATWRSGSLRAVVLISDEEFGTDPNGPSRAETIRELRRDGIRVIGVEIDPPAQAAVFDAAGRTYASQLRQQLEAVARDTGAFAPGGGVDCTGNGTHEVAEGSPMVCSIPIDEAAGIARMADPLTRILTSLVDRQTVRLGAAAPRGVAVQIDPPRGFAGVNVKAASSHAFSLTVRCTGAVVDPSPLRFELIVAARVVAVEGTTVSCGQHPAPVVPRPVPPFAIAPPAGAQIQPASPNTPNHLANPGAYGQFQANPAPRDQDEAQESRQHEFRAVRRTDVLPSSLSIAGLTAFALFATGVCLAARKRRCEPAGKTVPVCRR